MSNPFDNILLSTEKIMEMRDRAIAMEEIRERYKSPGSVADSIGARDAYRNACVRWFEQTNQLQE